jgi:hypothetical protein
MKRIMRIGKFRIMHRFYCVFYNSLIFQRVTKYRNLFNRLIISELKIQVNKNIDITKI